MNKIFFLKHYAPEKAILAYMSILRTVSSNLVSFEMASWLPNMKSISYGTEQNGSTEGCSKLKVSVDMKSSGKNGLNIRTNASPKWDRTRCPEE